MIKLSKFLRPYLWPLVLIVIFVYIQVETNLELPDYMARIVNDGIVGEDTGLIWRTGGEMLLVTLVGAVSAVIVGYLAARVATGFSRDLRDRVFTRVEDFSLIEFSRFSTASLITRTTNDIQQIQTVLVMFLRMVLMAPMMGIGAILKAYHTAPSMSWIMASAVAILLSTIALLFSLGMPKFKILQNFVDRLNLVSRQILTGLRVIRAFNTEAQEEEKFDQVNHDLTKLNLFTNRLMVVMHPVMMLVLNLASLLVVWVGAHLISDGDLMIGDMIAYMQYSMQAIFSFLMISIIFIMIPRASVSAQRVSEVIETLPAIADPESPRVFPTEAKGRIEFKNVSFAYAGADEPVIENISFTAQPAQTTAFVGSTGSGKSTLINLIPRFFDITEGKILFDGIDIREVKQRDLRSRIGYVPQHGVIFSGTVESNINFGDEQISDAKVKTSADVAQATEFIDDLAEGFASEISQDGTNISGGQKQRLSIARALAKDPDVFIFDDSFSALDFKTDAALREALDKQTSEATVLIVAQRIGTVIDADQIVVLEKGRIVGTGRHEDLMKSCEVYREIALSQLSEEELSSASSSKTMRSENK